MQKFVALLIAGICLVGALAVTAPNGYEAAYMVYEVDHYVFHTGSPTTDVPAYAFYSNSVTKDGFRRLEIHSSGVFPEIAQMFASGALEGHLTHEAIWNHHTNAMNILDLDYETSNYRVFLENNMNAVIANATAHKDFDPYWFQVHLTIQQLKGLLYGYNTAAPADKQLTLVELYMHNSMGDLLTLKDALNTNLKARSPEDFDLSMHCTGTVRLKDDLTDIFFAQSAWFYYGFMNRVLKVYNLNVAPSGATRVAFSSYPGMLASFDSFYITDQRLAILETTYEIYDTSLYSYVRAGENSTLPSWLRVNIASRTATSGKEWVQTFSKRNSGTYNNQWLVLDYKKFVSGEAPPANTLWIAEQTPGQVTSKDISTDLYKRNFFYSVNIPYLTSTYERCGYPEHYKGHHADRRYQDWNDYELSSRGRLFDSIMPWVDKTVDFEAFVRSNDPIKHSTEQHGYYNNGMSSRCDIPISVEGYTPKPFGAIDAKWTSARFVQDSEGGLQFRAIAGPTLGATHATLDQLKEHKLPSFSFSEWDKKYPNATTSHVGLLDSYEFDWTDFGDSAGCPDLNEDECLASTHCGWCSSPASCVPGDSDGPWNSCSFDNYEFASKLNLYLGLLIGLLVMIVWVLCCWWSGIKEARFHYEIFGPPPEESTETQQSVADEVDDHFDSVV